jgi:hypothetical protein
MKNKILLRRESLEASRGTLTYQIENLKPFYAKLQVAVWEAQLDLVNAQLGDLPTVEQVKVNAKRTTAMIKDARKTILKSKF